MAAAQPRVLIVDDEPHVLAALRRQFRDRFAVDTAAGAREALAKIAEHEAYSVVVSDYEMPQGDGAQFLAAVQEDAPDTTRILLTGQADLSGVAAAVNEGGIFRFLLKPAPPEAVVAALDAGVEQYRLVRAERELLDQTLRGSVRALIDLLALANPSVFARAVRLRELLRSVLRAAGLPFDWHLELAVMFSQVGAITLPPTVLEHLETGQLDSEELVMVERMPRLANELLRKIPRLELVSEAIRRQDDDPGDPDMPLGARTLRVVHDFDLLERRCGSAQRALDVMKERVGRYDDRLLEGLAGAVLELGGRAPVDMPLAGLIAGMVVAEDVTTTSGLRLVSRGHEVDEHLITRLQNFSSTTAGVREPVTVYVPRDARSMEHRS